jgi:hypothetical protein
MPITDASKKVRKITVGTEVMPLYNGKYNIEAVLKEDGTQTLNIFDWDYVEPQYWDSTFANNTPAQISRVSAEIEKNGYTSAQVAEIYGWNLGDTHDITLTNGEVIQVRIIGFNHDTLSSDHTSKAGITLDMVTCLNTDYAMNTSHTNAGGYFGSNFVLVNLPTIYDMLPEEWKAVIKPVDKKATNGGGRYYSEIITQSCNIFLLSAVEIGDGTKAEHGEEEGTCYEYWQGKSNADRTKLHTDGTAISKGGWYLRSVPLPSILPESEQSGAYMYFSRVWNASGDIRYLGAKNVAGISFAFCV